MPGNHIRSLATGAVGPQLVSLAWPILCSGVLGVFDASVNVMWVGREFGDVAVAALANANLLWMLLFSGAFGVSMAGTVWIGRSLGRGDIQGARAAVATMVSASGAVSVLCVLPMLVLARRVLGWLGVPPVSLAESVEYLRVLLLSVPLIYVDCAVIAALEAAGDSKTGFYFSIGCLALDAALNPIFIIGLGPLPPLGIAGSAVATLASQTTGAAAMLWQVYRKGHALRLGRGNLCLLWIPWARLAALLRDGGPMAAQFLWGSVEQMLMISLVNRFGADTTAAYGVVIQLWNFIIMPPTALGVAITVIVAQSIGAGRWDRVQRVTRLGLVYGVLTTAMLVALVEVLDKEVCQIFLPAGSQSLGLARGINREATWSLIFLGAYTVWTGVLRATGEVWAPLAISVGVLAVRFPVTAALIGHWRAQAIWWSFPASAVATITVAALHGRFARA